MTKVKDKIHFSLIFASQVKSAIVEIHQLTWKVLLELKFTLTKELNKFSTPVGLHLKSVVNMFSFDFRINVKINVSRFIKNDQDV